jgi:hypothetical protein
VLGGHGAREQREDRRGGEQQQEIEQADRDHLVAVVGRDQKRRDGEQVVERRLERLIALTGEPELARADRAAGGIDVLDDRHHLPGDVAATQPRQRAVLGDLFDERDVRQLVHRGEDVKAKGGHAPDHGDRNDLRRDQHRDRPRAPTHREAGHDRRSYSRRRSPGEAGPQQHTPPDRDRARRGRNSTRPRTATARGGIATARAPPGRDP